MFIFRKWNSNFWSHGWRSKQKNCLNISFNPFMTEAVIISKPVHWFAMDWFLYDNGLRHERVKWFGSKYCFWSFILWIVYKTDISEMKKQHSCDTIFLQKSSIFSVAFIWFLEQGILKKKSRDQLSFSNRNL